MATRTVRHPFLFVLSTLALLIGVLAMPQASAEESASFMYGRAHAGLIGEGFEPGIDVTITVSDGREFVTTAGPDSSNPSQVAWEFDQPVAPGETITVSSEPAGGAVTKTLLVEEVAITTIRHREDVVEGIAPAGATLNVGPDGEVVTTVASDGTFVADLGAAGFDIQPGADGYAVYAGLDDADGDTSRYDATAPEIIVDPVTDELWLNGFEHHLGIELLLGGDGTPGTAARSLVVEHDGSGDAHLDLHGDFDITPGLDIYAWSPTTIPLVRHHVVTNLTLDPWNDRILSGTADPGSEVCIDVFGVGETCVIADGGTWSYDPGVEGAAAVAQYDDDDDSTQLRSAGAPWFLADQVWDDLWGHGFAPNASVDVSVDGSLFGTYPTDRGGYFAADPGSIPLDIGSVVEVTDGAATKTLTLSNLLVTDVDVATDTVSGTGTPGAEIWIGDPFDPDYAASRTVTVQSDGTWFADFTVPGDGGATWDFQPGDEGFTHQSDADGDVTHVRWRASVPPWVTADPGTDAVWGGGGWQGGVPITVTIDDPGTAVSPDFSGTTELGTYPDNPDEFYLEPGFDIQPGFTVEATDGVATKILFVTSLQITDIDFDNDLVSGTADDGLQVWIDGGNDEEIDWAFRVVDVVGGSFTADFGNPGPMEHEQDTVDLVPGSRGTAQQYDDDGDYTHAFWHTEVPETPWMTVDPDSDSVWGGGSWEIGVPITVTIDDPATADAPDFTGTTEMLPTEWDPGYHEFWLDTGFDILSGFTVEATDGVTTKSLLVADIHDIVLDPTTAIVTGYAVPGTWVNVNLGNDAEWAWRDVPTDATGFFSADLGTPVAEGESGDGVMTVPLPEGTGGAVQQTDDDGDGTHVGLCHGCGGGDEEFYGFAVFPEDDFLQVEGWWEAGRDLTITIATDEAFTDVLLSETVFNEHGHLHFAPEFDIQRGMWIAVDDGLVRREHRVQNLYVDGHDEIGDTVYGRADVGTVVIVQAHFDGGIESVRHVYAGADADDGVLDGLGPWLADFSVEGTEPDVYEGPQIVFDIGAPGSGVTSEQRQGGGETDVEFGFPLPFFQVDPEADFVWGQEWPEGATVTISVYQDETLGTLLHEQTAPVERWGDNSWEVGFDAELGFDVQAGQFVTVTDGDVMKTLAVSALSGVTFAPDTGVVSGSTDPYAWVEINVGNDFEWAWRNLHVDDTGFFSVDFSAPPGPDQDGDGVITAPVAEGTGGDVRIPDEDRDATAVGFCHGCGDGHEGPRIRASLTDDWISLEEWSDDLSVTVEIPGLFGPESVPVYDGHGWLDRWGQHGVDLEPGTTIVATGDETGIVKELTLIDGVSIVYFEAADDLSYGTAPPDTPVEVSAGDERGGCGFNVVADATGSWTADFAADPCFFDVLEGMGTEASVADDDGDYTSVSPTGIIMVGFIGDDEGQPHVSAGGWPLDETIHLTVTDPDGVVVYETEAISGPWFGPGPPVDTMAGFDMGDFWVQRGQILTVSHPTRISVLPVSHIRIDAIDVVSDTVSGSGGFGTLDVFAGAEFRAIEPAPDGTWSVSFSDIGRNTDVGVNDLGYEGGLTEVRAQVEQQGGLLVNTDPSWLWLFDDQRFPASADGEVQVYADPADEVPMWTTPVTTNESGGFFLDPLGHDLQPGMSVRIEFGDLARTYTEVEIVDLAVTSYDPYGEVVTGTAPGHTQVWVRPFDPAHPDPSDPEASCGTVYPVVDGVWTADYGEPGDCQDFDIEWGMDVLLALFHDNGDLQRRVQPMNRAPTIESITGPAGPIMIGTEAYFEVAFSDPDSETHTVTWDFGDGTTAETSTGAATHVYQAPGVYSVPVTVTDGHGAFDQDVFEFVVVYDPDGGHVTGGGWFLAEGEDANFGLTARYHQDTAKGQVNAVVDGVHLHSEGLAWLVITPESTAHLSGGATLDGATGFEFRVDVSDGTSGDAIRIRVWDVGTGELVLDVGGDLAGGQIKIHD